MSNHEVWCTGSHEDATCKANIDYVPDSNQLQSEISRLKKELREKQAKLHHLDQTFFKEVPFDDCHDTECIRIRNIAQEKS